MQTQLSNIADFAFDLLVVGGGIVGACVAWDAAQRGLSVLLVEKSDFGSGTSANSLRILHGGLRYIQRGDVRTMRESIRERSTWLRIAPHLTQPLPVVVPDFGAARENRFLLRAALAVNDLLSADRNRHLPADHAIPSSRLLSAGECRHLVEELPARGLRGGVLFHDAQIYGAERLVLEIVRAAAEQGAIVQNYLELEGWRRGDTGSIVNLRDHRSGELLQARCRIIVNATGSWLPSVLSSSDNGIESPRYAAALNLVLDRRALRAAWAISSNPGNTSNRTRRLFVVPWRGRTLIGTAHYSLPAGACPEYDPEPLVLQFLDEVNRALPGEPIRRQEVRHVNFGLLPIRDGANDPASGLLRRGVILEGAEPILHVASVKFTGARSLAQQVVDRVFARLERPSPRCRTDVTLLPAAPDTPMAATLHDASLRYGGTCDHEVLEHLVRSYGRDYHRILSEAAEDPDGMRRVVDDSPVIAAQFRYGLTHELALRSNDLLHRRTEIGPVGSVTPAAERLARSAVEDYATGTS